MFKILEKVLNRSFMSFLEIFQILAPNQYGFRKEISVGGVTLDLANSVVKLLDNKNKCLCIFLDLLKAFDRSLFPFYKRSSLGIRGIPYKFFKDYLVHRKLCVRVGTTLVTRVRYVMASARQHTWSYSVPDFCELPMYYATTQHLYLYLCG